MILHIVRVLLYEAAFLSPAKHKLNTDTCIKKYKLFKKFAYGPQWFLKLNFISCVLQLLYK